MATSFRDHYGGSRPFDLHEVAAQNHLLEEQARAEAREDRRRAQVAERRLEAATRVLDATRQAAHWSRVLEELNNYQHSPPRSRRRRRRSRSSNRSGR